LAGAWPAEWRWLTAPDVGRKLTDQEVGQIVNFLRTLTGQLPTDYIKEPALPPGTEATPKPDKR
jgi:cytochrome c peroxidase